MRLRSKMRFVIASSVISVAILILLQKRSLESSTKIWLTSKGTEMHDIRRNNMNDSMVFKDDWKHIKERTRKKEIIQAAFGDTTVEERTSQAGNFITEIVNVPRKEENADKRTSNKKVSIGKRRKKEKAERHKAHQNMLIFDKRKRYLSKKVIETKSTTNQKGKELKNQCPKWKYERENWTIVYHASHAEYNRTLCPKPSNGKIIKRILFNDGTFLNTGCNKNTRDCKEYPFYDFKEGVRINTPPCCRHHVLTMFDHVTIELKRQGVSHSMISGGVIGLVRNKGMIPYDRDLDLIIEIDYWNTTEFWKMFQRLHEKYGYVADDVEEFKVKLYLSKLNRNNIDIWAYWAENDTVSIAFHGFKKQSMKTMMPFKAVRFEWFSTFAPAKPIQYLDRQYGKEVWRPEKQCMVRNAEGDCW